MATLLIIGGTGFFGKSILDAHRRGLLKSWDIGKIIVMSRNTKKLVNDCPELISDKVELLNGDISKIDFLPDADFVIHAAASTDASRYLSHNKEEKQNIISATLNYCRLALKFHKNSKVVFCSSGAVYGYQPENVKYLTEDMDLGTIERLDFVKKSYAYAKKDSEYAIQELGQNGLNVSIARCFAFVGKYLPRDQHFAIGNFIADGVAGRDIKVKANNKVYRSYMYAYDLVKWLMILAQNSQPQCPIYNVASETEIEIGKLANLVADIFNVSVVYTENNSRPVDRYIPSVKKAINKFGLYDNYGLKESILMSVSR